jgi:hypothetical protein
MNPTAIYSKSGKGVQEASGKTSLLKRPDRAVLSAIDGRANLGEVAQKVGQQFDAGFQQLVAQLDKEGFIREVTPGTAAAAATKPATARPKAAPTAPLDASSDLDFTATLQRSAPPKPPDAAAQARAKEQEAALYKARQEAEAKAQAERDRLRAEAEAKARSEEEAKLRAETERKIREEAEAKAKAKTEVALRMVAEAKAKAEAEAKARIEAERRAREEVERRALEAAERVRKEAEGKAREEAERARREAEELRQQLEEERKAREEAERRAKGEEERLSREEAERNEREAERRRQEEAAVEAISRAREEAERNAERAAKEAERAAKAEAKGTKTEFGVGSLDGLLTDLDSFSKREEQERQEEKEAADRRDEEDKHRKARHAERRAQEEARRVKEEAQERERALELEKREAEERRLRKEEEKRARQESEQERESEEQERIAREEARRKQEEEERRRKAREEERAASKAVAGGAGEAYVDRETARRRKEALLYSTRPVRAERHKSTLGKPMAAILFLLLVVGVGGVHVMPIATNEYEKMASKALGRPVKVDAARVSLLTGVQLKFEGVTIGDGGKIALVRAHPEIGSLFGDRKAFSRIELEGVTISQQALGEALFTRVKGDNFRVSRIAANALKLEGPVPLPPLDVEAVVGLDGALRSVHLRGPDNLMGKLTPKESEVEFEMTAAGFPVPFAPAITLSQFAMKGSANRRGMNIASWGGSILDGVIGGSARVRWGDGWHVEGLLTARGINAAVFAPALLSEGKAEASGRFSMSGAEPAKLVRSGRIEGSFTIGKGVLGSFDLGKAIQTSGRQFVGRTQFTELYGQGVYNRGAVALRNVTIAAGALNAGASADIAESGALNARIVSDLRTPTQTVRLIMNLGGTVRDPQVRN